MKKIDIPRLVESVGPTNFLKYFNLFANNYRYRSNQVFRNAFSDENWEKNSAGNIASSGKRIFREGLEISALMHLSESKDYKISNKALYILNNHVFELD